MSSPIRGDWVFRRGWALKRQELKQSILDSYISYNVRANFILFMLSCSREGHHVVFGEEIQTQNLNIDNINEVVKQTFCP